MGHFVEPKLKTHSFNLKMATIYLEVSEVKEKALQNFSKEFGVNADVCVCAPGRVNLIGEHTDYNEGFVLPMVIIAIICFIKLRHIL